jgi:hypothetical protein
MPGLIVLIATALGLVFVIATPIIIFLIRFWRTVDKMTELPRSGLLMLGEGAPPPEQVDQAIMDFIDEWGRTFGGGRVALFEEIEGALITWHAGDSFPNPRPSGKNLRGLTVDKRRIEVAARDGPIGNTALFHELVHLALWNLNDDPDWDHDGDQAEGWTKDHDIMIKRLKERWS